ncbi:MAG: hypothetical protein R6X02_32085 [Enhygromyxa sp.]
MTTDRLPHFLSLALAYSLVLSGTACVGFINGDDDGSDDEVGDGDGDTGDGDGDGGATIYAIQQGEFGEGMIVTVEGVIVTSPVNAEDGLVFVQEPESGQFSGISLYMWSEVVSSTPLKPGDVVNVTGEYAEFYGMSQLVVKEPGDITVVGTDTVPGPDVVTAAEVARDNTAAEPWEGVRVQVVDAVIAEPNDGFGQYLLVGDALVGNAFVDPLPQVQVGGTFSSVTGPLHYSYEEFKIQPTGAADLAGYQSAEPTEATSIYDIQMEKVAIGTVVKLEGVIASSGYTWSLSSDASFFVQESAGGPFSGIQVHVANTAGLAVTPGDQLTIIGTYDEFFGMSQIEVEGASAVTMTGSGAAPMPEIIADPATIATGGSMAEDYEGVLVRVEDVTVIDENPDAPMDFNEFAVTGNLRVDDMFFTMAEWTRPTVGASFASITGPLVYAHSNFKLEPRDAADLESN